MGKMGSFDASQLIKLQQEMQKLGERQANEFCEACAKELAARLLTKVIKRTPVGRYSREIEVTAKRNSKKHKKGETYTKKVNTSGKQGGTLRRGWTAKKGIGSEGLHTNSTAEFVDTLKVNHYDDTYVIEITNPEEYASYVEYGHRTRDHKNWVKGKYMLKISVAELEQITPGLLEKRLEEFLGEVFQ